MFLALIQLTRIDRVSRICNLQLQNEPPSLVRILITPPHLFVHKDCYFSVSQGQNCKK